MFKRAFGRSKENLVDLDPEDGKDDPKSEDKKGEKKDHKKEKEKKDSKNKGKDAKKDKKDSNKDDDGDSELIKTGIHHKKRSRDALEQDKAIDFQVFCTFQCIRLFSVGTAHLDH